MEGIRHLGAVPAPPGVQERNAGGNRQQADAFRKALEQHGQPQGDGAPDRPPPEPAVRRALQLRADAGRKHDGDAMHVDVIA